MANKITYTLTDEAPALATYSLLPIIQRFLRTADIEVEVKNISLASRVLAAFSEELLPHQKVEDALHYLGELVHEPDANIIKLPNISASVPQLRATINELQEKGYPLPDYPLEPTTEAEISLRKKYDRIKGSAVNPVLREGNSDRRAPKAVKEFAKKHPHKMGEWSADSKTHVASMPTGDFYASEISCTIEKGTTVKIIFENEKGYISQLGDPIPLLSGEIIDASFMRKSTFVEFIEQEKQSAKKEGILFSLHLKATMMKVSDPVLFGLVVKTFFKEVFEKNQEAFKGVNFNPNNGWRNVLNAIDQLEGSVLEKIHKDIEDCLQESPDIAMVNSDLGITNLHVPSDVIIDASMPAMIRNGGKMWNKQGTAQDAKAIIPDRTYASIYQEVIDFCKVHGAFDPTTMGTVPNVGLMAQKAEEYGSHDKTFIVKEKGAMKVIDEDGKVLLSNQVDQGDIWRMCQTKKAPVLNWIDLAIERANSTQWPTVFWLDHQRAHDVELIKLVERQLASADEKLDIKIMAPAQAMRYTLERVKKGENTISVTGNVLRDYLTDLFPILELGTSAKMLSIVPLMKGGGLFETGAGGSAPKHVQQFEAENHLRWDSLGEFLALSVALEHLSKRTNKLEVAVLARTLDVATERLLMEGKSPSRKVKEIDNRGSHFYLALFWAEALVEQSDDLDMKDAFAPLARSLRENEKDFMQTLIEEQGDAVDLKGYYAPNCEAVDKAMRPSNLFNELIAK